MLVLQLRLSLTILRHVLYRLLYRDSFTRMLLCLGEVAADPTARLLGLIRC